MRKSHLIIYFLFFLTYSLCANSINSNALLGYNGLYQENSWTPLQIRLNNNGSTLSGELIVEVNNSSTAIEQKRVYRKPVDLSSGSTKNFTFTIPLGHHNRDLKYYLISENQILLEDTIELQKRGIRESFILSVSAYPDQDLPTNHPVFDNRLMAFPHPDLLPDNPYAYDSVDLISMKREIFDKLPNRHFEALAGWVNNGGVLIVWGGKSPAPAKREFLPCKITGLERLRKGNDIVLVNKIEVTDENRFIIPGTSIVGANKKSGIGEIFFIPFDYSGTLKQWKGISDIWEILNDSASPIDIFSDEVNQPFLLENYILMFDSSEFNYLGRLNAALILFLSASIVVSLSIYVRLRRKSKNLYKLISILILSMVLSSSLIYGLLYNNSSRNECFVLDINILLQQGKSEKARLYKDLLIGSSAKTNSDIIFTEITQGILKREDKENLQIIQKPEFIIKDIDLNTWSSQMYRLEQISNSNCNLYILENESSPTVVIENTSDYFFRDSFLIYNGNIYKTEGILPGSNKRLSIDPSNDSKSFSQNPFLNKIADFYTDMIDLEQNIVFGAFTTEDTSSVETSNPKWKIRSETLILNTVNTDGINND